MGRVTHGKANTKIYKIWKDMKARCYIPSSTSYENYGGRGIRVCDSWLTFEEFYKDMVASYKEGLSIERIDVNGNYSPENCRWANSKEQKNNTRRNRYIAYKDIKKTLAQWSEDLNIPRTRITQRIDAYKWTVGQALEIEERI